MESIAILTDLARRPADSLAAIADSLDPAVLNVHVGGHPNSPAWLLWHTGREIDVQIADLAGTEQVWTAQGFDARFDLGLDDAELGAAQMGYGQSAEQAERIVVDDPRLLIDYIEAATEAQVDYVSQLTEAQVAEVIDEQWDPPVTRAGRLISVSVDAAEHIAQVAYVLGTDAAYGAR
ncbi:DUF664 domain-containing protein [Brevibacterium sp. 5221]|uniref:DUF664 domain-containing protein n=1 Tax=Brevibacterium rongguiense TaxID=2695267 RepID=A0A6N9H7P7_9MICO|nr:DinB family protein [Brevibacterium rongguiense]MYM19925.1 DUF664 domain-containing protein [Brevibacterium rongguiense]